MFSFVENLKFEEIFKNKNFIEYLKAMKIDEEIKGYAEVEIELIFFTRVFQISFSAENQNYDFKQIILQSIISFPEEAQ